MNKTFRGFKERNRYSVDDKVKKNNKQSYANNNKIQTNQVAK